MRAMVRQQQAFGDRLLALGERVRALEERESIPWQPRALQRCAAQGALADAAKESQAGGDTTSACGERGDARCRSARTVF
jgi:hypothetical protein